MDSSETQKTLQIHSENKNLNAMGHSETQKTIQIHSENANFECRGTLRNTEHITDPQRKTNLSAMESAKTQKTLRIFNGYCGRDIR